MPQALKPQGFHPRCPCVLLLDTSQSMDGPKIEQVTSGLHTLKQELLQDSLARARVELSVVLFNEQIEEIQPFAPIDSFMPPVLQAAGRTAMGAAIAYALESLSRRKRDYNDRGIPYYQPLLFLITDGAPTDPAALDNIRGELLQRQRRAKLTFSAIGVDQADMNLLASLSAGPAYQLTGMQMTSLFKWISKSTSAGSRGSGEQGQGAPPPPSAVRIHHQAQDRD